MNLSYFYQIPIFSKTAIESVTANGDKLAKKVAFLYFAVILLKSFASLKGFGGASENIAGFLVSNTYLAMLISSALTVLIGAAMVGIMKFLAGKNGTFKGDLSAIFIANISFAILQALHMQFIPNEWIALAVGLWGFAVLVRILEVAHKISGLYAIAVAFAGMIILMAPAFLLAYILV